MCCTVNKCFHFYCLLLDALVQGCPTYGPQARIQPARRFHPARESYEAYWHSTTWEVLWISFALIDDFQQRFEDFRSTLTSWSWWVIRFKLIPQVLLLSTKWNSLTFRMTVTWRELFSEQDLLSFDSGYVSSDSYPNLSQDAKNFTALFGSTYTAASNCFREWKIQK